MIILLVMLQKKSLYELINNIITPGKTGILLSFFIIHAIPLYSSAAEEQPVFIEKNTSCITATCHARMGAKKYIHAAGLNPRLCTWCHEMKNPDKHKFERLPEITKPLCARCHSEEPPASVKFDRKPPAVIFEDKDSVPHTPFAEGKCTSCHDAHESQYPRHLKASYPEGLYARFSLDLYGLCTNCHKDFANVLTAPRTLELTQFRNGNLNLHFRHVNKKKGRTCEACHHHHRSKNAKLIRETFSFGKRTLIMNYTKTATGGNCAPTCHSPVQYDRYDPVEIHMRTSPREGRDATSDELKKSRERDMEKLKTTPEASQKNEI